MKLFQSLCILGLVNAQTVDPRGKNKKNKEKVNDEPASAPGVVASISLSDSDPSSSVELMWKQDEPVADFTIYAFDDSTPAVKVPIDAAFTVSMMNTGITLEPAIPKCTFSNVPVSCIFEDFKVVEFTDDFEIVLTAQNSFPLNTIEITKNDLDIERTTTTTTTTTTKWYPEEIECSLKKGKSLDCNKRNMHNAEWLIQYLMDIKAAGRGKITSADFSSNNVLGINTIMQVLAYLPNLKSLKLREMNFEHGQFPPTLLSKNLALTSLDISDNHLICVRGAFDDLKLKKLSFGGNPALEVLADGKSKAKKKKIAGVVELFDSVPKDICFYA